MSCRQITSKARCDSPSGCVVALATRWRLAGRGPLVNCKGQGKIGHGARGCRSHVREKAWSILPKSALGEIESLVDDVPVPRVQYR